MKGFFEKIGEMRKDSKGRAILFFGFYLLFFLVIAVLARVGGSDSSYYSNSDFLDKPYSFNTHYLNDQNYSYEYVITLDGDVLNIQGKRNKGNELFTYQGKEYYCNENSCFEKDDLWVKTEKLYPFSSFCSTTGLLSLVDASFYESTTDYASGKKTYNFLLSTNTINHMLHHLDSDFLEEPNKVIVNADEDNEVYRFVLYLDSYCTLNKSCKSSLKIEAQYDNFGKIEEIENPTLS